MTLWLLLAAAFVAQEPVVASALVLAAYQHGYSVWLMHALFAAATTFDAAAGYGVGYLLRRRYADARLSRWIMRQAHTFDRLMGRHSKRLFLFVWGPIIFPLSAILAPWFGYTFMESLLLSLGGDLLFWYGSIWLVVLGVHTTIPNPLWALFAVAGISLAVTLVAKHIFSSGAR